jgi:hypothetical protein
VHCEIAGNATQMLDLTNKSAPEETETLMNGGLITFVILVLSAFIAAPIAAFLFYRRRKQRYVIMITLFSLTEIHFSVAVETAPQMQAGELSENSLISEIFVSSSEKIGQLFLLNAYAFRDFFPSY